MPCLDDPRLLAPFVVTGEAVVRDRKVHDHNNAPKTDEQEWLENARADASEISDAELKFLDELKRRVNLAN